MGGVTQGYGAGCWGGIQRHGGHLEHGGGHRDMKGAAEGTHRRGKGQLEGLGGHRDLGGAAGGWGVCEGEFWRDQGPGGHLGGALGDQGRGTRVT